MANTHTHTRAAAAHGQHTHTHTHACMYDSIWLQWRHWHAPRLKYRPSPSHSTTFFTSPAFSAWQLPHLQPNWTLTNEFQMESTQWKYPSLRSTPPSLSALLLSYSIFPARCSWPRPLIATSSIWNFFPFFDVGQNDPFGHSGTWALGLLGTWCIALERPAMR